LFVYRYACEKEGGSKEESSSEEACSKEKGSG
jgi:hypothetical protein